MLIKILLVIIVLLLFSINETLNDIKEQGENDGKRW